MVQTFLVMVTITLSRGIYVQNFAIPDTDHPVCGRGACGKICYDDMQRMYPGLFYTQKEMASKVKQEAANREKVLQSEGVTILDTDVLRGDGDACCGTEKNHTIKYTMTSTSGQVRYIVHMPDNAPPRYQLVPHAKCVLHYGNCIGRCVLEPIYITLLVYDFNSSVSPPLMFDTFEVPGYCSCKNVFANQNK